MECPSQLAKLNEADIVMDYEKIVYIIHECRQWQYGCDFHIEGFRRCGLNRKNAKNFYFEHYCEKNPKSPERLIDGIFIEKNLQWFTCFSQRLCKTARTLATFLQNLWNTTAMLIKIKNCCTRSIQVDYHKDKSWNVIRSNNYSNKQLFLPL